MNKKQGYRSIPFSINRKMVAASTSVGREQSNIHAIIEVDISKPRQMIREIKTQTGESPSLTAYVTTCLAKTVSEYPNFNSFRKGRNLIILDDVTISVLVEKGDQWGDRARESRHSSRTIQNISTNSRRH